MVAELEILKILANLSIFLLSVTIGTYSIAVSFLGPRYSKAILLITQEKERLEKELKEGMASQTMKLEELEKRIAEFRRKEKIMKGKYGPLSLLRTVFLPSIFLGFSLFSTLVGIYTLEDGSFFVASFSFFVLVVLGLVFLGRALLGIQKVARETAITLREIGRDEER